MSAPLILWKPWVDRSGQPSAVPDPNGKFVAKADYDALLDKLTAAQQKLSAIEAKDEAIKTAADAPA